MFGIVIGASSESIFAIGEAKKMGLTVLAFDGDKEAPGLAAADEAYVVDIRKPEKIYEILDQKKITRENGMILPVPIGRYLISAGAVNDHYGLVGLSEKSANFCTDKYLFHQLLSKSGLRNADCQLLKCGEIPKEEPAYPSIVKPRFGAGNRGVWQIDNRKQWEDFMKQTPIEEDYVVETLAEGIEYGVDAMVINGEFKLVLLRKKMLTPPPARQCVGYYSVLESEEEEWRKIVCEHLENVSKVLGLTNTILHADIIRRKGNSPFVIELSARPSGHRLHDVFTPLVTGINMIECYIQLIQGKLDTVKEKIESTEKNKAGEESYLIHYFDMEDCEVTKIPTEEELRKKYPLVGYECHLNMGYQGKVVDGHSVMGRGYFILKGKREEELVELSRRFLREYVGRERIAR